MKTLSIFSLLCLSCMASSAMADHRSHANYARVVDVYPIYKIRENLAPRRHCWTETAQHNDLADTVAGGLIGNAIGRSVGHSRNDRHTGALVGTLVGMAIGKEIGRNNRKSRHQVEYCEIRHTSVRKRVLTGYEVTYKHRGRLYQTQTRRHPGKRIRLTHNRRHH